MSKQILQSVGDDTVAFGDQLYWVSENVKKFMPNFAPGMEVDITVKDIDGTPMVTFMKKSGFSPAGGQRPAYGGAPQQQGGYQKPAYQPQAPPRPPTPTPSVSNDGIFILAAAMCAAYQLDIDKVKSIAKELRAPPKPPIIAPAPVQPVAPPMPVPAPVEYSADPY